MRCGKLLSRIGLGCAVVCISVYLLMWRLFADHESYAEHLASHELLPCSASDISVYRNQNISGIFLADFAVSEAEFIRWAHSYGWDVKELNEPQQIRDAQAAARGDMHRSRVISRGLHFRQRRPNGGGVDLAYDRAAGRGYISRSSR